MSDINLKLSVPVKNNIENNNSSSKNDTIDEFINILKSKHENTQENLANKKINDYWLLYSLDKDFRTELSPMVNSENLSFDSFKNKFINNHEQLDNVYKNINKTGDFLI